MILSGRGALGCLGSLASPFFRLSYAVASGRSGCSGSVSLMARGSADASAVLAYIRRLKLVKVEDIYMGAE
jgi:hypothetical protein